MPTKKASDDTTTETTPDNVDEQSTEWDGSVDDTADRLAAEVLGGLHGDHHSARVALTEAGHDASAVMTRVNARLAGGAPSAHPAESINLLQEIKDGEWGGSKGLYQRLAAAGFSPAVVTEVRRNLEAS
jgi:hypothetical protein